MEKKMCVKCGVKPNLSYGSNVDDRCSSCANKATLSGLMQLAAITLFVLAALFPPWEETTLYLNLGMQAKEFYGFSFLWDRPRTHAVYRYPEVSHDTNRSSAVASYLQRERTHIGKSKPYEYPLFLLDCSTGDSGGGVLCCVEISAVETVSAEL